MEGLFIDLPLHCPTLLSLPYFCFVFFLQFFFSFLLQHPHKLIITKITGDNINLPSRLSTVYLDTKLLSFSSRKSSLTNQPTSASLLKEKKNKRKTGRPPNSVPFQPLRCKKIITKLYTILCVTTFMTFHCVAIGFPFSLFFFLISHIWKIKINKKENTDNSFACTVAFWNELEIFIIV